MKIAVVGSKGMLGRNLLGWLDVGHEVAGLDIDEIDIRVREQTVAGIEELRPQQAGRGGSGPPDLPAIVYRTHRLADRAPPGKLGRTGPRSGGPHPGSRLSPTTRRRSSSCDHGSGR